MKILFLNNWLQDVENLAYPHGWIDSRFKRHIKLLKEMMERHGIEYGTLETMKLEDADVYVWQERYRTESELFPQIISSGKPCILIATEPPVVCPVNYAVENAKLFWKIFTWRTDLIDYKKYYPIRPMHFDPPQATNHRKYEDRKLCTMIASLKVKYDEPDCLYRERKKTADWFAEQHPKDFDFYCHKERFADNACYRGSVEDKIDTLSKYRFSICYENMKDCPGYISEKIFDSMYAGCIPVYWGEADITKYIPEDCFIDRRKFASHEALYDYMASMTKEEWERYYDNMMQFLKTSEFVQSYRPEAFAESLEKYFLQELCEDR